MERKIITTGDGSHSIEVPEMKVTYHSVHGAIQESMHVFIEAGFRHVISKLGDQGITIRILEMGFGTGLNALLTLKEIENLNFSVHYTALELSPLEQQQAALLNYCEQLSRKDLESFFIKLHTSEWEKDNSITPNSILHKTNVSLLNYSTTDHYHLVYYDAFAPAAQPELWTREVFEKLNGMMAPGGILVTYCSKGDVRKALLGAGFSVERIPGPKGKREMLRGTS
jgi:tRNA U34 5-methylaminomethyl-2-thiouridine-forming methyltransferase MnmC